MDWREMETLSQRLKEEWGKEKSFLLTSSSNFIKDDSFTYTKKGAKGLLLCSDIYRSTLSSGGRITGRPWASTSKTMVLQYTRGRLNKVFVGMKNVMINLITDSAGDLWVDRGRWWKDGRYGLNRIRKRGRVWETLKREKNSLILYSYI